MRGLMMGKPNQSQINLGSPMDNPATMVIAVFEVARDQERDILQSVRNAYNAAPSEELRALLCTHHKRFMAACDVVEALAKYAALNGGK